MKKVNNNILDNLVVVKRSGQRVEFNSTKIAVAIKHSFDSVSSFNEKNVNKVFEDVLSYINLNYEFRKTINVEDIQDIIENKLQQNKYLNVYKSFNEYRIRRAESRKAFSTKQQHKFVKAIEHLAKDNSLVNDNNTKPIDTLINFGKTVSNEFTKAYILDSKFVRAHEEGSIYIHDLDYFSLGIFNKVSLKLNKNSILDYDIFKLLNILIEVKNEVNNEIFIGPIDNLLIPFIIKNYKALLKEKLVKYLNVSGYTNYINNKKIEEIIDHENNFINDFGVFNQIILNEHVKQIFDIARKDTLDSLNNMTNNLFDNILTYLNQQNKVIYSLSFGTNKTAVGEFINEHLLKKLDDLPPLSNVTTIFKLKKNTSNYDLEKVSNLIIQNKNIKISFVDNSYNKDDINEIEYFSNGERIFENILASEKESLGRISLATTSINLSRLGFKHSKLTDFYKELDELLELVKNELIFIFESLGDKNIENFSILFKGNILDDEKLEANQKIRKVIKNGVLNIGFVGLKECVSNMVEDDIKQKDLMLEILKYMNKACNKFSIENKLNFVISETTDLTVLKELIALDKTIYGVNNIINKEHYELVNNIKLSNTTPIDFTFIGAYQHIIIGGSLLEIKLPKNITNKKLIEMLQMMCDYDVGFAKIEIK